MSPSSNDLKQFEAFPMKHFLVEEEYVVQLGAGGFGLAQLRRLFVLDVAAKLTSLAFASFSG